MTLTIPALMSCRCVVAIVPLDRKAKAVYDALYGPISEKCPASILRTHDDAALFLDEGASFDAENLNEIHYQSKIFSYFRPMDRKNYKIKDIAAMAGVSVGTVDRVLHNRGDVSEKSRKKVEQVLEKILYRPNLLVSSIGVKRKITLAIVLPSHQQGEYWEQIEKGIHQALYDFSKIRTETKIFYYDQFDLYSCRTAYSQALEYHLRRNDHRPDFPGGNRAFLSQTRRTGNPLCLHRYAHSVVQPTGVLRA